MSLSVAVELPAACYVHNKNTRALHAPAEAILPAAAAVGKAQAAAEAVAVMPPAEAAVEVPWAAAGVPAAQAAPQVASAGER